jgi:hypothetical protein
MKTAATGIFRMALKEARRKPYLVLPIAGSQTTSRQCLGLASAPKSRLPLRQRRKYGHRADHGLAGVPHQHEHSWKDGDAAGTVNRQLERLPFARDARRHGAAEALLMSSPILPPER